MKTLYDISWQVEEATYREDRALSYSTLAKYARDGFSKLSTLFDKVESPSLLFGSVVDTLLTEPDRFEELYSVGELNNLTESLQPIAAYISANHSEYTSLTTMPDEILSSVGAMFGYFVDPKYEKTRIKRIRENCEEYFQIKKKLGNKTLISKDLYTDARECVEELKSNEYTRWYFEEDNPFQSHIQRFYQLKFKGEFDSIPIRMMADLIIVDHEKKKIIPCDLKTSYKHESEFFKSYIEWSYFIQSSLYTYIIKQNIAKSKEYKDYTVEPYRFIVISKNSKAPMVWEDRSSTNVLQLTLPNGKELPFWGDLLKELDGYMNANTLRYPYWTKEVNDIWSMINNERNL